MSMHADTFKPPEQGQQPSAKDLFSFLVAIFYLAVLTLGVFWAMLAKKPGTVGTRAYWFDALCGITLLVALSQNWWYPDRYLFQASIPLMAVLYFTHLSATLKRTEHVHTQCIGSSRFGRGDNGKLWEFMVGGTTGLCICLAGCVPYGVFVLSSAVANTIRQAMVDERDRRRTVQMADAMDEQAYMMDLHEKYQRERPNQ